MLPAEMLHTLHTLVDVVLVALPLAGIAVGASVLTGAVLNRWRDL